MFVYVSCNGFFTSFLRPELDDAFRSVCRVPIGATPSSTHPLVQCPDNQLSVTTIYRRSFKLIGPLATDLKTFQ